ncbi:hypothetical protein EI555_021677 [Monodon monoceros]|uniref:Peroxiredoxin-1 n=1 Tax=Monodon monoceros TaxID=40151 RepID=A0A4U1EMH7_MONMO|nr:hypothetical protein EI555_021677 [Monodon monoceros]
MNLKQGGKLCVAEIFAILWMWDSLVPVQRMSNVVMMPLTENKMENASLAEIQLLMTDVTFTLLSQKQVFFQGEPTPSTIGMEEITGTLSSCPDVKAFVFRIPGLHILRKLFIHQIFADSFPVPSAQEALWGQWERQAATANKGRNKMISENGKHGEEKNTCDNNAGREGDRLEMERHFFPGWDIITIIVTIIVTITIITIIIPIITNTIITIITIIPFLITILILNTILFTPSCTACNFSLMRSLMENSAKPVLEAEGIGGSMVFSHKGRAQGVYLPGEGGPCIGMLTAKEGNFCCGQSRGRDRQQAREMGEKSREQTVCPTWIREEAILVSEEDLQPDFIFWLQIDDCGPRSHVMVSCVGIKGLYPNLVTLWLHGDDQFREDKRLHSSYESYHSQDDTIKEMPKLAPCAPFKATAVMPDGQFKDISLSDYKGKYVVFFLYPLDSTFVCPMEITAFSDRSEEFKKLNCQVIGASVDSYFCHMAWINTPKKQGGLGPMNIPLISDPKCIIAQDYGFTDKHGEVCPAGCKPGSDTIKPDVQKRKEYFSKQKSQKAGDVAVIHFMSSEFDTQGKTVQKQINSWYSKAGSNIVCPAWSINKANEVNLELSSDFSTEPTNDYTPFAHLQDHSNTHRNQNKGFSAAPSTTWDWSDVIYHLSGLSLVQVHPLLDYPKARREEKIERLKGLVCPRHYDRSHYFHSKEYALALEHSKINVESYTTVNAMDNI